MSQPDLLEAFRKAQKQGDKTDKIQQKVIKPLKIVDIAKATGEANEVKETGMPKHEEKTREATREKPQEKRKEIKMTLKKRVSMESTLPTERFSTSRNINKTQVVALKKENIMQKKVTERQKTEENIEKKRMVEDALAVAKILDMAKTMPPVIELDAKIKTKRQRIHTEVEKFCEKENELVRSTTFDSPITKRIMEPRKIGMNLTVITQR